MSSSSDEQSLSDSLVLLAQETIHDLARVVASEAGGENETAQTMVGWAVVNRMKSGWHQRVSDVWRNGNFAHSSPPTYTSLRIAEGILTGTIADISQGITHFYAECHAKDGRNSAFRVGRKRRLGERHGSDQERQADRELPAGLGEKVPQNRCSNGVGERFQVLQAIMKRFILLSWLTLMGTGTLNAASSAASWDPDATAPFVPDVAAAAAHAIEIGCETPSCRAIVVINKLLDIVHYENGDANGIASLYVGKRPEIAGRRLDRTLLDHPELYGPVCAIAAKLVSRVHPESGHIFVPVTLLLNSVDMDLRNHGHCAEALVTALPRDPGNDQIRMNARDLCINGDEDHRRSKAACAVLVQGVDEKAAVARGLEP